MERRASMYSGIGRAHGLLIGINGTAVMLRSQVVDTIDFINNLGGGVDQELIAEVEKECHKTLDILGSESSLAKNLFNSLIQLKLRVKVS